MKSKNCDVKGSKSSDCDKIEEDTETSRSYRSVARALDASQYMQAGQNEAIIRKFLHLLDVNGFEILKDGAPAPLRAIEAFIARASS